MCIDSVIEFMSNYMMENKNISLVKIIFVFGIPIAIFQTIVFFLISILTGGVHSLVWLLLSLIIAYFCFQSLDVNASVWRRVVKTGGFVLFVNFLCFTFMSAIFLALFSDFDPRVFGQYN